MGPAAPVSIRTFVGTLTTAVIGTPRATSREAAVIVGDKPLLSQGARFEELKQETIVYPGGSVSASTAFVTGSGPQFVMPNRIVTVPPSGTGLGKALSMMACISALPAGFLIPVPLSITVGWFRKLLFWSVT